MPRREPVKGRISIILNLVMVSMYAVGGIILFFWPMPSLPDTNRYIIASVLVVYSAYRGMILYRKFRDTSS